MFHFSRRRAAAAALALLLAALAPLAAAAPGGRAQGPADNAKEAPPFREYKGVRIGMTAEEARKKLGSAADKSDKQDFYVFSDEETAQVFYDAEKKVSAVAVVYAGGKNAPTCSAVFGKEAPPKPDGSQYMRVQYPKAGYWVSYSRTAGDSPITSVTMQKKM